MTELYVPPSTIWLNYETRYCEWRWSEDDDHGDGLRYDLAAPPPEALGLTEEEAQKIGSAIMKTRSYGKTAEHHDVALGKAAFYALPYRFARVRPTPDGEACYECGTTDFYKICVSCNPEIAALAAMGGE